MEQIYIPKHDYKVLTLCMTFNHSKYIENTLNGFAMQQTNFPFVCLIMDDCSTDGEQEVIKTWMERECDMTKVEYEEIEKSNIIIVPHKMNNNCTFAFYFLKQNMYKVKQEKLLFVNPWLKHCKYESICEGDDCWNNPLKLQMQADYLDSHPKCVLVHTDFNRENVQTKVVEHAVWRHSTNYNQINRQWDKKLAGLILQGKYSCITLTCMIRIKDLLEVEEERREVTTISLLMGDTQNWMLLSRRGSVHFIPEVTSTYHVIPESATHSKNYSNIIRFYSSCIDMIDIFSKHLQIETAGQKAKQTYIYFLLRDIYLGDKSYLKEIEEKVIRGVTLNLSNSLLINTINAPTIVKKPIMLVVKIVDKLTSKLAFYNAKCLAV